MAALLTHPRLSQVSLGLVAKALGAKPLKAGSVLMKSKSSAYEKAPLPTALPVPKTDVVLDAP